MRLKFNREIGATCLTVRHIAPARCGLPSAMPPPLDGKSRCFVDNGPSPDAGSSERHRPRLTGDRPPVPLCPATGGAEGHGVAQGLLRCRPRIQGRRETPDLRIPTLPPLSYRRRASWMMQSRMASARMGSPIGDAMGRRRDRAQRQPLLASSETASRLTSSVNWRPPWPMRQLSAPLVAWQRCLSVRRSRKTPMFWRASATPAVRRSAPRAGSVRRRSDGLAERTVIGSEHL